MILAWLALGCAPVASREELVVLAAASLTDAFGDLERAFEADHPGIDVVPSFAGTQALATQVRQGMAADVFASADAEHAEALAAEGLVERPRPFASNALVLAVPGDSPLADLEQLAEAERIVVGGPDVPVGRYTATMLDAAGDRYGEAWREDVEARVVSREHDVRQVVAKVAMGEADAALVYATDVASAPGVRAVVLPEDLAPAVTYEHARLVASPHPELAAEWLAFVEGEAGRAALARRGFRQPAGEP